MSECLIALGGNLQISEKVFKDALGQLQLLGCSDVEMSRAIRTRPVGANAGQEFLNAAAVLHTDLGPDELLRSLHKIEAMFHRVRTHHWGPRTLDLDLILYGDRISDVPQLVVPHPAMWYRRFVLEPAIEVAADMVHPTLNVSIAGLHNRLVRRPLRLEICSLGSVADHRLFNEIMHYVRDTGSDETEWHPTDPGAVIERNSFARIILRQGELMRPSQRLNRTNREIEVGGDTAAEAWSRIEHLMIAMLG